MDFLSHPLMVRRMASKTSKVRGTQDTKLYEIRWNRSSYENGVHNATGASAIT
jgi:hypothetical protein